MRRTEMLQEIRKMRFETMMVKQFQSKFSVSRISPGLTSTGSCRYHTRQKKSHSRKYAVQTEFIVPKLTASYWFAFQSCF